VDGQFRCSGSGDGAWEWSLGDYADDSLHEIMIQLTWGGYAEWGKRLSINRVHHFGGGVEIDYMDGHAPSQEDLDVLEAYYIQLGYHRAEFHLEDVVPYVYEFDLSTDGVTPSQQYYYYENAYRDHNGDPRWEWMLCLHYLTWKGERKDWLGLCWGDYGILVQDQLLLDLASWPLAPSTSAFRRTVILHEYGHHLNILDLNSDGTERYSVNDRCTMHKVALLLWLNIMDHPWYCEHHWSEHRGMD